MTSDEIVKALRCGEDANGTPRTEPSDGELVCYDTLKLAAADLIDRLEKEKAALLGYAKKNAGCAQCANYRSRCDAVDCNQCAEDCPCKKCKHGSKWEWKGLEDE